MGDTLRNGCWNAIHFAFMHRLNIGHPRKYIDEKAWDHAVIVWVNVLKLAADEVPAYGNEFYGRIKAYAYRDWITMYETLEFVATRVHSGTALHNFRASLNHMLQTEGSGYRLLGKEFVRITDPVELEAISDAQKHAGALTPVAMHLQAASRLMSDRTAPDFRNSIKESISAVESVCAILANIDKADLAKALLVLEQRGLKLHAAMKSGFSKLYGYTSDASGIRHAAIAFPTADYAEAKYMLVACSAFVNFLVEKSTRLNSPDTLGSKD